MPEMIQIRNVPDDVHRTFKVRAAEAGMSLSDYLKPELGHIARIPTLPEMLDRLSRRPPVELTTPIEEIVRETRQEH
jgi:plasmid stability protein